MWMWRLCVTGMEKQMTILSQFKTYHHRQVVLNYYDDEDFLYQRDGLFFDTIQLDEQFVSFIKEGKIAYQLSLTEYPNFNVLTDFNHHYLFFNETNHVDLYFPY